MNNQFDQLYDCVTIESIVLHNFESYLHRLSCMHIPCCVNETDWKGTLISEFQSHVFDDFSNMLVSAHCTMTSNVLTATDEIKITKDVYFQSCQLMFRCLNDIVNFFFTWGKDRQNWSMVFDDMKFLILLLIFPIVRTRYGPWASCCCCCLTKCFSYMNPL